MERKKIRHIIREYVETDVETPNKGLEILFKGCVEKIYSAFKNIYGQVPNIPDVRLEFNNDFKDGKIGAFVHPKHDDDHGVMLIKTKAIEDGGEEYVKHIITHELIHAVFGHKNHEHDEKFHRLSDAVGLPSEYRD